jgi:thioredoxin-dependent peroxiredoxin
MAILIRSAAPDFALDGWHGNALDHFSLSAQRGRRVVLAFYPGDERLVCTRQMCAYSDEVGELGRLDAEVWGIAPQSVDSHRKFAQGRKLKIPLLSDPDMTVARQYGVVGAFGLRRSVFVIDPFGNVAWRWVSTINLKFPSAEEIRWAVADVAAA